MAEGPSSGQRLEVHHLDKYWRTIIWTTTRAPSSEKLVEDHHLEKY
jgi:hypothetical protein